MSKEYHILELIAQMKLVQFNHVSAMKQFEYKRKFRVAMAMFVRFPFPFNFFVIFLILIYFALSLSLWLFVSSVLIYLCNFFVIISPPVSPLYALISSISFHPLLRAMQSFFIYIYIFFSFLSIREYEFIYFIFLRYFALKF